jgi:ribosomal protein L13
MCYYIYIRKNNQRKKMARKLKVNPSGKNGECITVVKGSKAKVTGLTKDQIKRLIIKQTLERQNPRR